MLIFAADRTPATPNDFLRQKILGQADAACYFSGMGRNADQRRRRLGAIFLAAALVMLIAGETVLPDRLGQLGFLLYWLVCLLFTLLAILVAFLDLVIVRRRTRAEQRELVAGTLEEIARARELQTRGPPRPPGNSR